MTYGVNLKCLYISLKPQVSGLVELRKLQSVAGDKKTENSEHMNCKHLKVVEVDVCVRLQGR